MFQAWRIVGPPHFKTIDPATHPLLTYSVNRISPKMLKFKY